MLSILKRNLSYVIFSLTILYFLFVSTTRSHAFTCHRATVGPITCEISKIPPITVDGETCRAPLIIENSSNNDIRISGFFSSVDSVFFYGVYDSIPEKLLENEKTVNSFEKEFFVKANSKITTSLVFSVSNPFRDAHYPIRAQFSFELDGKQANLELRAVFSTAITNFNSQNDTLNALELKQNSFLKLSTPNISDFAPYWKRFDGEISPLPIGWSGSEKNSLASFNPCTMTRGGIPRSSWSIHPPFNGGAGVLGLRFLVDLPQTNEIELRFYRAMRDVLPPEAPTDGVIFRVYATILGEASHNVSYAELQELLAKEPNSNDVLLNEQVDKTEWSEIKVNLTDYAGKKILLTFEADPGVKRDTTCDNSFWGDVTLIANPSHATLLSQQERERLRLENEKAFLEFSSRKNVTTPSEGVELKDNVRGFCLEDGQFAVVSLGKYGVCDSWISIGTHDRYLQIDGVRARYQGCSVGFEQPLVSQNVVTEFVENDQLEYSARLFAHLRNSDVIGDLPLDANFDLEELEKIEPLTNPDNSLACYISQTQGGLAFRFVSSHNEEIESLQFGPISQKASRVYFGHGHCIINPVGAFTQSGDGFGCSSSHVGFDFENGISLLQATTRPVKDFYVDPEAKIYTLTASPDSRLTLRTSEKGAFDCAIKYANGFDKKAAPLVPKKAGRFVYDYWGGSFNELLERMKIFLSYGLTDTLLIQHVWQRYGYDVRLPDIWPPNQAQGSIDDLKQLQSFCDENHIPFGLHDNYIDFYPDADDFSYQSIIMNSDGSPQKAWYNPGPDVQSYRFNPTKIFPFAERNLNLIRENVMQTAYFTDVFSSIHIMDFYDSEGNFHSRAETLDCWNKYFDLVRSKFNNNAITISESGNDALTGHLEGADAILRRITPIQENFSTVIPCEDHEYVPWLDAVVHNKFILHGVGYSDRYQGGLSRALRGIESDDYLSSEVLTGHALMVDLATSTRGVVRKYWLLQNLARSLAMDEIVGFEFVDNDEHKQKIEWKSGVTIYVNRGDNDWTINEVQIPNCEIPVVVPKYGFWSSSKKDGSYGGILKIDNQVVELRVDPDGYFVNGRQEVSNQAVPIRPFIENVKPLDHSTISASLIWDAYQSTDQPYEPFLHLERPKTWWADRPNLYVLPLESPKKRSDTWQGRESDLFGKEFKIILPEDLEDGHYNLLCGLYDKASGRRLQLLGWGTEDRRCVLGTVTVKGRVPNREIKFEPVQDVSLSDVRLIPNKDSTNFGRCSTKGAFRFETKSNSRFLLTPLPNEPAFEVSLNDEVFRQNVFTVIERNQQGKEIARYLIEPRAGSLSLTLDSSKVFTYELIKR